MIFEDFSAIAEDQINTCWETLGVKGEEYAADDDRLLNFRRAAALQSTTLRQALAGMMVKHTVSVYELAARDELANILVWNEKLTDHINYLLLLKAVVIEEANTIANLRGQ